jgi:hypothetical protein
MSSAPEDQACNELVELVTEYLEGSLPVSEVERIEGHLAICTGCEAHFEQMRALAGGLDGLERDSLAAEKRGALLDAFRRSNL